MTIMRVWGAAHWRMYGLLDWVGIDLKAFGCPGAKARLEGP